LESLTSREKYGLAGLVIRTSCPSIERTSAGSFFAIITLVREIVVRNYSASWSVHDP